MIDFTYTAKDLSTDQIVKASVKAESAEAAAKLLTQRKLFPIEIIPASESSLLARVGFKKRIKSKEKVLFTRQLSTLINAGLPLARALRSVEEQIKNPAFKEVIGGVIAAVEGGSSLSEGFAQYPKVFNEIYVALVAAGETSGTLDKTLLRLADQQEKDAAITSKIRSALIYPAIVLVLIVAVIILMLTTVVPQVAKLYSDLHKDLPLATQVLLFLSNLITKYWWLNIIILGGLAYGVRRALHNEQVEALLDRYKLSVPLFGSIMTKVYMARFTRTMNTLLASGVPILQALETTRKVVTNRVLQADITKATGQVRGGKALSDSLEGTHFIQLVPQMIRIGEESGAIDEMMDRVALYYEAEVDEAVKNLSTTLEPVMMVVLGGIVMLILAAVLGPIYSLVGSGALSGTK
ncbi:MAG TPA: type II secretion system F family protein [Candidatus Saccharimonadales bacterium]|nr:type II secretion system F family protein [Candidatus Saccharimonadales bacterium]